MSLQMLMALFDDAFVSGPAYKTWDNATQTFSSNENTNNNCAVWIQPLTTGELRKRTEGYGTHTFAVADSYCTVLPTTAFGDDYHVRLTAVASSSIYTGALTLGTWYALTTFRSFTFSASQSGPSSINQDYDFDISDDAGSTTLDTTRITVSLNWDSP